MLTGIISFIIIVFLVILITSIKSVPQSSEWIIERMGPYHTTWETGLHVKMPFIDKIKKKISLKEQVVDFPPQPVITRDNIMMQIDTVVFFEVIDSKQFTYGVERPISAIENLSATTLRNIIGDMAFDETLNSRDSINTKITAILDAATDKWGIKVNRVELKNIIPPTDIQKAMEKEAKAERERRAIMLEAQGTKDSQILVAEGEKQSAILRAEAEKETAILHADAEREKRILEAQGEAEAILMVQKATADGIALLNTSCPTQQVLTLKSFEAMEKVADGKATKIIIPSELQNMGGLLTAAAEVVKADVK